jgi:transcriptional regulator with XRE-family HTH domain
MMESRREELQRRERPDQVRESRDTPGGCDLATRNLSEENPMLIGDRLKTLREAKNYSQGEIEKRTGLLRCYISRVENGHTVPAIETLEKFARALEVPMYELFYDGEEPPKLPSLPKRNTENDVAWGSAGKDERMLLRFRRLLSKTKEKGRRTLLFMAQKMAGSHRARH